VFTKIGANIGDVAILPASEPTYNFSQNVAGAKIRHDKIASHYLACLFSTAHGKAQVRRVQMLSGQGKLELADIRRLLIPPASRELQARISALYRSAELELHRARQIYDTAEQQFLALIGLGTWQPTHSPIFIKSSQALNSVHRIDAEYFQPKFEAAFENLKKDVRLVHLMRLARLIKGIEVGSAAYFDRGCPFWRVSDLSRFGLQDQPGNFIREDLYVRLRKDWEPKAGELLLSKDATPGLAFYLTRPVVGILASGILRLSLTDDVPGSYLELVLNSRFVQLQIERDSGGSVIQHWRPTDVKKTLIPRLKEEQQLADQVAQSHRARADAKRLLEQARTAVEILIESGENEALATLDQIQTSDVAK
jgi:type I restriction enzyme S subunit